MTTKTRTDPALVAHLLRRAGFGGTRDEIERLTALDYEAAVDSLLKAQDTTSMRDDIIRRYHPDQSDLRVQPGAGSNWIYHMVTTDAPLREKIALLWHRVFATGQTKLIQGKVVATQIGMLRRYGLGSFRDLLVQLSRDPAMIMWLDNQDNHRSSINENYGREILELFSMGIGNYTEQDVKECSRAFTGWTVANTDYMAIKMRNNTMRPYGYIAWQFRYDDSDHDPGEKTFLGRTGNFTGEDVIDIICEQPATARFVARHLYHHLVADEVPVPQWPHVPPRDPQAIDLLVNAYFESRYSIAAMVRALFLSDAFKNARYARIKSPVELVVGTLRLAGGYDWPTMDVYKANEACNSMGQSLLAPPSVEGWIGGDSWISTGSMIERVNFAAGVIGDQGRPGVKRIVDDVKKQGATDSETLVDRCLEHVTRLDVTDATRSSLLDFDSKQAASGADIAQRTTSMLQLIVSTREYQMA